MESIDPQNEPLPPPDSSGESTPRGLLHSLRSLLDVGPFDWKCAVILTLGTILLTVVHYQSKFYTLDDRYRLFAWFGVNFVALLLVPLLVIRFVFRERLADYGFQLGDYRQWGKFLLIFLAVMVPVAAIASRIPEFHDYYPRYKPILDNRLMILPSMAGWLLYFMAWEFFFRGFMLMGLGKRLGPIAIFIQMVPFTMAHFPKPELESFAAIIAGVALGIMAWRTKSFVGPWLLHWLAATSMDVFVVFWPLR